MSAGIPPTQGMPEASTVTPKTVIAVGAVLPSLAAIAVALRFYVRIGRKNYVSWDDFLILFALILTLGLGIMMIVGSSEHALAQPTPLGNGPMGFFTVLNETIVTTEKMKWVFNLLQVMILAAIKLSVICFYRRIFRGKTFELYSKCMIGVVLAWTVAFFFAFFFECGTQFQYLWSTLLDLMTHCANEPIFFKGFAISDVILDGLILIMPMPVIWHLQMSLERKLALCAVFLLGFVAVAAGLARVGIFVTQLTDSYSQSQGILIMTTWMYWNMLEIGLSIVAACLPTLRPLFNKESFRSWYDSLMSSSRLRSKFSMLGRSKGSSSSSQHDSIPSSDVVGVGVVLPRMTSHAYPVKQQEDASIDMDMEAQTTHGGHPVVPGSRITVRDKIEQSFYYTE